MYCCHPDDITFIKTGIMNRINNKLLVTLLTVVGWSRGSAFSLSGIYLNLTALCMCNPYSLGTCFQPVGMFAEMERIWQQSLYYPSLRSTQAFNVWVTLFVPLPTKHMLYHSSTSPSLALPSLQWFPAIKCTLLVKQYLWFIRLNSLIACFYLPNIYIQNKENTCSLLLLK